MRVAAHQQTFPSLLHRGRSSLMYKTRIFGICSSRLCKLFGKFGMYKGFLSFSIQLYINQLLKDSKLKLTLCSSKVSLVLYLVYILVKY